MENMREEIVYYYAYYYKEEIHWTCKSEETLLWDSVFSLNVCYVCSLNPLEYLTLISKY
jgi:hypothetical protein